LFVALKISWNHTQKFENKYERKSLDSLIAAIVIGGTLITYFVFIATQIDSIISNTLPLNVEEVSSLVK